MFVRFIFLVSSFLILEAYHINVHYDQNSGNLVNSGFVFQSQPSSEVLADVCSKLAGNMPFLREDQSDFPVLLHREPKANSPIVFANVHGYVPTQSAVEVKAVPEVPMNMIHDMANVLRQSGVESKVYEHYNAASLESFLNSQNGPVILFSSETADSHRKLISSVAPLTEFQISQYQIVLWTAFVAALILLAALFSIVNMEIVPDSLLMAKFQSNRTGKRD